MEISGNIMIVVTSSPKKWKIGAELIKFYQKTKFSHVAIIKGDLVFQASHGSVNCMHISVFLKDNVIIDRFYVPNDSVDMNFVKLQLGKKYSLWQIVQIALDYITGIKITISNGNEKFICSEFVGKALRLKWVNEHTTPLEIAKYLKERGR
jgi:hypothetical protein